MARYVAWGVPLLSLIAGFIVECDAFVVSPRWLAKSTAFRRQGMSHCSATPVGTRFLTTVLGATEDTSSTDQEEPVTSSPPDVYYEGLVGGQPINDDDAEVNKFTDYPINLPSYLLLCLATVGSIAFTGSIFEVIGKHPQLGYTATYIIGTLALPTFIFLFYAAIKKGQAEVEEDDAKYDGPW